MERLINIEHKGNILPIIHNGKNIMKEIEKNSNHFFEIHMLSEIAKLPYRPGVCMDIGANVGNHTIFFSRFCNFDEVWAYEPNPRSFELLQENVKNNCKRTVRLFNCAIGEKRKRVNFTNHVENPAINKVTKGKGDTLMIPVTTNLKVSLIKMDVEGYELKAIEGAYDVIDREKPELFIETHGDWKDLLKALPQGYRLVRRYGNAPMFHFTYA